MRQRKINKYFRVLLGDIFIVPFLGPALVYLTGVGKFGCNWLEWFARGQGIWLQIFEKCQIPTSLTLIGALLKWGDVDFNQSEKGIKSKIDILLILTNHYFHAQNLSVKNGENNGVLAGVPILSPSRAQIPPSPSPFNACHAG